LHVIAVFPTTTGDLMNMLTIVSWSFGGGLWCLDSYKGDCNLRVDMLISPLWNKRMHLTSASYTLYDLNFEKILFFQLFSCPTPHISKMHIPFGFFSYFFLYVDHVNSFRWYIYIYIFLYCKRISDIFLYGVELHYQFLIV